MRTNLLPVLTVLLTAVAAHGQDMPLSQVLIPGEGWRAVAAEEAPAFPDPKTPLGSRTVPGVAQPSCAVAWLDGGTLVVGETTGRHLWAFRVEKDGSLSAGERYYPLRVRRGAANAGARALAIDTAGRVYAATPEGVQVFDPTGRLSGVLLKPCAGELTALSFGGAGQETLFVRCGDRVFARKTKAQGASAPRPSAPRP